MSSSINPAPTVGVTLENELPATDIITSDQMTNCTIQTGGRIRTDAELKKSPGSWGAPAIK
jgi:hypothetical protein